MIVLLFCWGGEGSLVFSVQNTSTYPLMQDVRSPSVGRNGVSRPGLQPAAPSFSPALFHSPPSSSHATLLPALHPSPQNKGYPCSHGFCETLSKGGKDSSPLISLIQTTDGRGLSPQSPGWSSAEQQKKAELAQPLAAAGLIKSWLLLVCPAESVFHPSSLPLLLCLGLSDKREHSILNVHSWKCF